MKRMVKTALKILGGLIVLGLVAPVAWVLYLEVVDGPVIDRCETLKLGMGRDEVVAVMGPSSAEYKYPREGQTERFALMWRVSPLLSTNPEVTFDHSTGKVEKIVCTD